MKKLILTILCMFLVACASMSPAVSGEKAISTKETSEIQGKPLYINNKDGDRVLTIMPLYRDGKPIGTILKDADDNVIGVCGIPSK